jgi:heme-degrading monooxygenase HmoA
MPRNFLESKESTMFCVIFEVNRKPDKQDEYLENAKHLKPILESIDGFIDNERFESKLRDGWLLSHSTWRDEKSVVRWRTQREHHHVQEKGRFEIFRDYHLRVGEVVSDTAPPPQVPIHEMRFDETQSGEGKYVTFTEVTPADGSSVGIQPQMIPAHLGLNTASQGLVNFEVWESINTKGKLALTAGWTTAELARAWKPTPFAGAKAIRHRVVRVVRDYGMFDRREAPQFYAEVPDRKSQAKAG